LGKGGERKTRERVSSNTSGGGKSPLGGLVGKKKHSVSTKKEGKDVLLVQRTIAGGGKKSAPGLRRRPKRTTLEGEGSFEKSANLG